jgi:hypothetical protein
VVFTVLSHGLGSVARTDLIFNHPSGQTSPWVWSAIHGVAVLAACCGVVIFWETTEREQRKTLDLTKQLADAEISRRRFTSDLLVNLARRNQSLLYRQLGLINQLEDQAEDPDALADLFRLDHLATRIRRNAESLLVLSGEEPPRTWGRPVALVDVVRAAIAETEDLDRVVFAVDERLAVFGNAVADLTHLMAELVENAVHFSPPEASVIIRTRPYLQTPGAHVLTVEDWGVGMRADDMAAANDLLATPRDVDLSVSQRLGLHVVARLAQRHGIEVSLTPTPGCGVTAAVVLPPSLFSDPDAAGEASPDDVEVPAAVLPAALAASMVAPAADLPPAPPGWGPPEEWTGLPDGPAGNGAGRPGGNGHEGDLGNGHGTEPPAGDETDWSGWWEPAPGAQEHGKPMSPLAARPPLSERAQAPVPPPPVPRAPVPPAAPEPHPPGAGAPEREGSRQPGAVPVTVHSPRTHNPPHPGPLAADDGGAEGLLLSRRVPQAHLAPELRRHGQAGATPGPDGPLPDAAEARAALSRYQASRQAARAVVDEGGAPDGRADELGPEHPPSPGGWP